MVSVTCRAGAAVQMSPATRRLALKENHGFTPMFLTAKAQRTQRKDKKGTNHGAHGEHGEKKWKDGDHGFHRFHGLEKKKHKRVEPQIPRAKKKWVSSDLTRILPHVIICYCFLWQKGDIALVEETTVQYQLPAAKRKHPSILKRSSS